MSLLDKQIKAIKQIYSEVEKAGYKIKPIIVGKFALTVYTQGMYPANIISFLFPDLNLMHKILKELGYELVGDFWTKDDIVVEISKNFELIPEGTFNQIEADGTIINVISIEDLLVDMMKQCLEGDEITCDLIKMIVKSYKKAIDFHNIYRKLKDKRAITRFREYQKLTV
ncbi:6-carboxyhexanoate--CoA ligase [Hydrogenivirga sp. 128-5-R1-1]|uniref:6-carboxyhexanoate--CoA ligase n=1 Tax=Hydrogenivirga sp. 128-5-R1-1 TaxID=392423 RepID=UPI00015F2C3F|nr:6-carboxyhexanoate--CoA ligase [Hydrogenivirga sp. 128-5-R1-1]EDP74183.1 6-carboxyhexanoate--CoA ligase [Hydrogenivirga sp. 128-5-R1-1]